jgi:hypothetical protein
MDAQRHAAALLEALRQSPLLRGGMSGPKRLLQRDVARAIEEGGALPRLAQRVGFQLVRKVDAAHLGNRATWCAVGERLQDEAERLQRRVGLTERQIIIALPKLSPEQVAHVLAELRAVDTTIARTVLHAALDAAEPLAAARRYVEAFHRVAKQLKEFDPRLARTLANGTFKARVPLTKAIEHFRQFAKLIVAFRGDAQFLRTVARTVFRKRDPIGAARKLLASYHAIAAELMATDLESGVVTYLAGIASVSANPVPTAHRLVHSFDDVFRFAVRTHPSVARSIALTSCRATEPLKAAQRYIDNYDRNRLQRSKAPKSRDIRLGVRH